MPEMKAMSAPFLFSIPDVVDGSAVAEIDLGRPYESLLVEIAVTNAPASATYTVRGAARGNDTVRSYQGVAGTNADVLHIESHECKAIQLVGITLSGVNSGGVTDINIRGVNALEEVTP